MYFGCQFLVPLVHFSFDVWYRMLNRPVRGATRIKLTRNTGDAGRSRLIYESVAEKA
jgi:hypothetical protein